MTPYVNILFILLALSENERTDLYDRIKKGDHSAFKSFYELNYDSLYRYLISRKVDPSTAEDLIQKAFVYIWENRSSIKPDLSLKSYLFRIAYTRMINHVKKNSKFDDDELSTHTYDGESPEDYLQYNDLKDALSAAVEKMPEKRQEVFKSCFINDRTYKETAAMLDVSVKTIENHMGLALKDVRSALGSFREKDKSKKD